MDMTKLTTSSYVKIALVLVLGLLVVGAIGFGSMGGWAFRFGGGEMTSMGSARVDAADVENLSIAWAAGSVDVTVTDGDSVEIEESALRGLTKAQQMRWSVTGGTLKIDYGSWFSCFSLDRKDLQVRIPRSCAERLGLVDVDGASGHYAVDGLTCDSLRLSLASGEMDVTNVKAADLSLDVASGQADIAGDFPGKVRLKTASGQTRIASEGSCPQQLDADVASGFVGIELPADAGFAARVDKASGSFTCGFPLMQEGDRIVCGDGSAAFGIHIASGEFRIDQS